jgi:hypothetical protein
VTGFFHRCIGPLVLLNGPQSTDLPWKVDLRIIAYALIELGFGADASGLQQTGEEASAAVCDPTVLVILAHDRSRQSQNPPLQKASAIPALPWSSKTAFEVFTRARPDNSLERLTERGVGLVTDRPSNVDELLVTLFE